MVHSLINLYYARLTRHWIQSSGFVLLTVKSFPLLVISSDAGRGFLLRYYCQNGFVVFLCWETPRFLHLRGHEKIINAMLDVLGLVRQKVECKLLWKPRVSKNKLFCYGKSIKNHWCSGFRALDPLHQKQCWLHVSPRHRFKHQRIKHNTGKNGQEYWLVRERLFIDFYMFHGIKSNYKRV